MSLRLIRIYIVSAGIILFVTASAKIFSGFGGAGLLKVSDPFLMLPFQYVFWIAGFLELFVALVCFFCKHALWSAGLVAWLSSLFLLYRVGLFWIGWHKACNCLGNFTDALHLQPKTADIMMQIVLVYLLIGSYGILLLLWKQSRTSAPSQRRMRMV